MPFQSLIQNIQKHINLTTEEENHFTDLLIPQKIKKKQFLIRENEISKQVAFVVSGCLKAYLIDQNGFEYILQFAQFAP